MKGSLKLMVYIIIIFGTLTVGTEVFRIIKLNIDINDSIQIMLEDSIELSIEDLYRRDHVTILIDGECEDNFYRMLRDKYRLDIHLAPIGDSYLVSPFIIESFDVNRGSYTSDELRAYQDENASARVKGYVEVKPMILSFNNNIRLSFNIFAESQRMD